MAPCSEVLPIRPAFSKGTVGCGSLMGFTGRQRSRGPYTSLLGQGSRSGKGAVGILRPASLTSRPFADFPCVFCFTSPCCDVTWDLHSGLSPGCHAGITNPGAAVLHRGARLCSLISTEICIGYFSFQGDVTKSSFLGKFL